MNENQRQIQSAIFGGDRIEITYLEPRHIKPTGVRLQTIQFVPSGLENELGEVFDAIDQLIDAYELTEANPPQRIAPRGRT